MKYQVKTFRAAGLEARWTKNRRGRPLIVLRDPNSDMAHQRENWYACDKVLWKTISEYKKDGIEDFVRKAFEDHTMFADLLSV
tara:strand:+ start:3966 stop:4214 length:249 start_codon:yes stop_codon:yes gene_type:complete